MFYSVEIFRTSSLGDSISSNPERTAPRRRGEEPGYTEALQWRAGNLSIKISLLIKENQITQVKEFSTSLCMGRARVWAHWNHSFDRGQYGLFTTWAPWRLPMGSGCSLMAARGQVFFPSWVPSGLTSSPSALVGAVISFVYWYGRQYSISH